ncbi:MAG: hypothetical protein V7K50_26160 [Nostoc sp.]|uniref:hypothetical protein n=1 Tax=Nostoc sp. TaxID=1180 RepID=UPI002FF8842C
MLNLTCLLIAAQPNTRNLANQDQVEIKILLSLKFNWGMGHGALGTCTEFRHFGYAQCIATLNYRVRVASRREVVGAASPRVVLGLGEFFAGFRPQPKQNCRYRHF